MERIEIHRVPMKRGVFPHPPLVTWFKHCTTFHPRGLWVMYVGENVFTRFVKILATNLETTAHPPLPMALCGWFICLIVVFHPTQEFFYSYGDATITGEGLQILTYAWHSWPLSSEGSLACHVYGASVYNGHLREPVTLHLLSSV